MDMIVENQVTKLLT